MGISYNWFRLHLSNQELLYGERNSMKQLYSISRIKGESGLQVNFKAYFKKQADLIKCQEPIWSCKILPPDNVSKISQGLVSISQVLIISVSFMLLD